MQTHSRLALLTLASGLAALCIQSSASAAAPDPATLRPAEYEIMAWSTDSSQFLVKVKDPNAGAMFQVWDTETAQLAKKGAKALVFPSPSIDDEPKLLKKIKKQNAMDQDVVDTAVHPKKSDIMLMTAQKEDKFVIMGVRGDKASKYDTIDVVKDKAGKVAKVNQKQLVWDHDGKNFILVYHVKLEGSDTPFEGDIIATYKFKPYKVKGGSGDEGGGE
ncbi:MAG: hypothetical protein U1F43_12620 [Myxococcota bacterium]